MLGRPLHHTPSKGGTEEYQRFYALYERTLETYQAVFEVMPPEDIWPDAQTRFEEDAFDGRINSHEYWIIPKKKVQSVFVASAAPLMVYLAAYKVPSLIGIPNPFDLPGPQFLMLYAIWFVSVAAFAYLIRTRRLFYSEEEVSIPSLDVYEIAYLNQGPKLAFQAAVARLIEINAIKLSPSTKGIPPSVKRMHDELENAHHLEWAIFKQSNLKHGGSVDAIWLGVRPNLDKIGDRLRRYELLATEDDELYRRIIPLWLVLIAMLPGIVKVWVGLERNRPVLFLIGMLGISLWVALGYFRKRVHRSSKGESVLRHYQKQATLEPQPQPSQASNLAALMAVSGVGVLAGSYVSLHQIFTERGKKENGGDGGGWWGGSDGGGGSDSGCGGGCGGCGGCGGN